jgi:membrane-bound lytic murein transglycosylase C
MFLKKSSSLWIIAGSSVLLLGASYASSMHGWAKQQAPQKAFIPTVSQPIDSTPSLGMVTNRVLSDSLPVMTPQSSLVESTASAQLTPQALPKISNDNSTATAQTPDVEDTSAERVPLQKRAAFQSVVENSPEQEPELSSYEKSGDVYAAEKQLKPNLPVTTIQAHAYEDEIVVEFPAHLARTSQIKKVLSRIMLSQSGLQETNFLQPAKFNLAAKPYYFNQVRDKSNFSIRYPAQAYEYAKVLMNDNAYWVEDDNQQFLHISIPLHSKDQIVASAFELQPKAIATLNSSQLNQYRQWAEQFAQEFNVPLDLVMAVMEVESAFNPLARSSSNALGLMQIKANAAGRDVLEMIDGKERSPSETELLNPENNIRIGVAYLGLLQHHYFAEVQDDRKKELLAISAYNSGLNTVLKLFDPQPEKAIQEVNRLPIAQVYNKLKANHQTEEARQYVDKVLLAKQNNHQT